MPGRKRKHTDGRYDRGKPPLGKILGNLNGINGAVLDKRRDKAGRLYVTVQWFCNPRLEITDRNCPVCHGKPMEHRWDKVQAGRVKSCGRLKKKLYREHIERKTKHPDIDVTGKPIPATARRKGKHAH